MCRHMRAALQNSGDTECQAEPVANTDVEVCRQVGPGSLQQIESFKSEVDGQTDRATLSD